MSPNKVFGHEIAKKWERALKDVWEALGDCRQWAQEERTCLWEVFRYSLMPLIDLISEEGPIYTIVTGVSLAAITDLARLPAEPISNSHDGRSRLIPRTRAQRLLQMMACGPLFGFLERNAAFLGDVLFQVKRKTKRRKKRK